MPYLMSEWEVFVGVVRLHLIEVQSELLLQIRFAWKSSSIIWSSIIQLLHRHTSSPLICFFCWDDYAALLLASTCKTSSLSSRWSASSSACLWEILTLTHSLSSKRSLSVRSHLLWRSVVARRERRRMFERGRVINRELMNVTRTMHGRNTEDYQLGKNERNEFKPII